MRRRQKVTDKQNAIKNPWQTSSAGDFGVDIEIYTANCAIYRS